MTVSIVLSFPMGILLALVRQSSLPIVRWGSIVYIEILRGFPLIGIVLIAQKMLPFFLTANVARDRVVRAIAGLTLFSGASCGIYGGIRGGLESVPRTQEEAATALGLSSPLMIRRYCR